MNTNRSLSIKRLLPALAGLLALSSAGCVEALLATHTAAFSAGYLTGVSGVQVVEQQVCFVNGAPVDCSTVNP